MKKQFVTYEIALALKELGFDEPCVGLFFIPNKQFTYNLPDTKPLDNEMVIKAPLWQQVEEWFRKKYSLFINILGDGLNGTLKGLYYSITEEGWINWYESADDSKWYDTFEEAREAAILEAIKLVKENKK
jgi:hypothetical protein